MHAVQLEHAFGYSVSGNAPVTNANAVGSSSVKIALIDTGQDTTHPELGTSKVVYQKCFITNPNGSQSTSNFTTDPWGHGTDVAGIAAAATNNALGFTGAGGLAPVIYGYRIFPTPDDNCASTAGRFAAGEIKGRASGLAESRRGPGVVCLARRDFKRRQLDY